MGDTTAFHTFTFYHIIAIGMFLTCWMILVLTKNIPAPSVAALREFVNVVDSKGGNVLVLLLLSVYFFSSSMGMFYYAFKLISNKQFDVQNAILLMGLQFVTGTCFGGSFSSMLKTMTGTANMSRVTDLPPANGTSSKTTETTSTTTSSSNPPTTHA